MKGGVNITGMNHERLWTLGNKLMPSEGRGVDDWDRMVMGIKGGTYCMEHWVLYANNESWDITKTKYANNEFEIMNHGTLLHQKLRMYSMVTNITK